MAKSNYKLTYFNWTGLGEMSRLIFALKGVDYEDIRIPFEGNFPQLSEEWKSKTPWGQVPLLEVDGKLIAQASAINRFLARRFDLVGDNDFEAAKCDEFVDAIKDHLTDWQKLFLERDESKQEKIRAELLAVAIPKYYNKFNTAIAENGGKSLVGNRLTWADIYLCHLGPYFEGFCKTEYIKNYPAVQAMVENFYDKPEVKKWIANSPKMPKFDMDIFNEKMRNPTLKIE